MARWEAFCLLMSIIAWEKVIFQTTGTLLAIGDALGMLHGAVRFKSRDPGINLTFMEMALRFAPRRYPGSCSSVVRGKRVGGRALQDRGRQCHPGGPRSGFAHYVVFT